MTRPPRVVFAHYDMPNDVGGVSSWIQTLVPDLRTRGIDARVHIANSSNSIPGPNISHLQAAGVPIRWAKPANTFQARVHQCIDWLNIERPDIYVPNCVLAALYAAGYARAHGLPTIGVLHSDDPSNNAIVEDFVVKDQATRFSSVVAVSSYIQQRIESLEIPNLSCHRIPCGVAIPTKKAARTSNTFRIAYIGRLAEEQKQISKVAMSLCEAATAHPTLEALIIGDGPARQSVESIVARSTVSNRVKVTGRLSPAEVLETLPSLHAFVLLSDYEGLPVSLLEAMAAGVVPICLKMRSGVEEVIQSRTNGILVTDRDGNFQAAVSHLLSDTEAWRTYSLAARATVETQFSLEICHRAWVKAIIALVECGSQTRYPLPLPRKVALPHPIFAWQEPDLLEQLLPSIMPLRNWAGRKRQSLFRR